MSVPAINEITRTEQWLRTVLVANPSIAAIVTNGDGTFRVYSGVMPQQVATYPALVFQWIGSPDDLRTMGPDRAWASSRYLIKGICKGPSALPLESLMDLVDRELHGAQSGATDAAIKYCRGIRPFRLTTYENNEYFQQIGREWEIAVSAQ